MVWALWGAATLPGCGGRPAVAAAAAAGDAGAPTKQQQPGSSSSSAGGAGNSGLASRLLSLPRHTLVQLSVLCYSHAVMGYCFFILQVRVCARAHM
jgi:hypothetical protein